MRSSALNFLTRLASHDRSAVDTTDLPPADPLAQFLLMRPAAFRKYAMLKATIELTSPAGQAGQHTGARVRPPRP